MTKSADILGSLRTAARGLQEERVRARKDFEANDRDYEKREAAVAAAITALRGGRGPSAARATSKKPQRRSIGEDRFEKVKKYLEKHHEARQSDIARALKLNGGTVHTALHILKEQGMIVEGGRVRQNGSTSKLWIRADAQTEAQKTA